MSPTPTTPRWQEYRRLDEVPPAARNPKGHDLAGIAASLDRLGYIEPVTLDERTGKLIGGHGRKEALEARKAAGKPPPDGIVVDEAGDWLVPVNRGWASVDDVEAETALVGLNYLTQKGGWEPLPLSEMLADIAASPLGLEGTGITELDLADLLDTIAQHEDEEDGDEDPGVRSDGSLLSLSDVTIGDPKHEVAHGDVWNVGGHVLVVADVMREWDRFTPFLDEGSLLVPYPGPYTALSTKADGHRLVLVQPDPFLAAHLLDKYASVKGEDGIQRADAPA